MNNDENIIFFDTETTGVIPRGKEEPLVYTDDFPHVVQLSWKLGDKEGDFTASLVDVKDDGHLVLQDAQGQQRRYAFKEVTFVIEKT